MKLFLYPFHGNNIDIKAAMFLALWLTAQKHQIIFLFCSRKVLKS